MGTSSTLVSYSKILHFSFYIINIVVLVSSTNRLGVFALTTSKKGYRFRLIHKDSLLPAHQNPRLDYRFRHIHRESLLPAHLNPGFAVPRVSADFRADIWADNKNLLFVVNISLGVPPTPQLVAMDTASPLLWVECDPCKSCSTEPSSRFKRLKSSTYSNISCNSSPCDDLRRGQCDTQRQCMYVLRYSDKTYIRGILANEQLTLKTSDDATDVQDVVFGCTYEHHVPDTLYPVSGILGLDDGPLSLIKQLGITRFSYCTSSLRDPYYSQNQLVLGDNANIEGYSTPLEIYGSRYYLKLEGISVGEKRLDIDQQVFERTSEGGGVVIDSGSTLSYLVAEAFEPLSKEINRHVRKLFSSNRQVIHPQGLLCYRGILDRDIHEFPVVTFHFAGGANLQLDVDSVFDQTESNAYCMAIGAVGRNDYSVIGMKAQQYHNIGYDLAAIQLSIQRIDCGLLQD